MKKEIDLVLAIYPGCFVSYRFPEYEKSTALILDSLGVEYRFIDDFACCGSQIEESNDELLFYLLSARNLAIAEREGVTEIITLCGSCTYSLKKAQVAMLERNFRNKINEYLQKDELQYNGTVKISHIIAFLHETKQFNSLKKNISTPFPARVSLHVPCMVFRPVGISRMNFDPAKTLRDLLEPCGMHVIEHQYTNRCCGGTMLAFNESVGKELAKKRYLELEKLDIDFILTACPNCQNTYGIYPAVLDFELVPSFFFTQAIALALGCSPKKVGLLQHHRKKQILKKLISIMQE